jgi:hypothetical protein
METFSPSAFTSNFGILTSPGKHGSLNFTEFSNWTKKEAGLCLLLVGLTVLIIWF